MGALLGDDDFSDSSAFASQVWIYDPDFSYTIEKQCFSGTKFAYQILLAELH